MWKNKRESGLFIPVGLHLNITHYIWLILKKKINNAKKAAKKYNLEHKQFLVGGILVDN